MAELFSFLIHHLMKWPIAMTWTLPEFNWVIGTEKKELPEFIWNKYRIYLERIKKRIKNSFYSINRICDDNNFKNPRNIDGFVDSTSNSKKFSFSRGNVYHVVQSSNNRFFMDINVSNGDCYVVLDTSIRNNKSIRMIW